MIAAGSVCDSEEMRYPSDDLFNCGLLITEVALFLWVLSILSKI